jgi:hypothetical protein
MHLLGVATLGIKIHYEIDDHGTDCASSCHCLWSLGMKMGMIGGFADDLLHDEVEWRSHYEVSIHSTSARFEFIFGDRPALGTGPG